MEEEWRTVPAFGGHYEVSSLGRVRVKDRTIRRKHPSTGKEYDFFYRGRLLSPNKQSRLGHLSVCIGQDGKDHTVSVHWLVLTTFVGPRPEGMEACHNNGIASDNRVENLRWDTHANNNADRKKHGTYATGDKHPMAKFTDDDLRKAAKAGVKTPQQLMAHLGVSRTHAYRIAGGKSRQVFVAEAGSK